MTVTQSISTTDTFPTTAPGESHKGTLIDRFDEVLESLHPDFQDRVLDFTADLDEIRLNKGGPLTFNQRNVFTNLREVIVSQQHINFTIDKTGGARSDGRAGIEQTLHRYAFRGNSQGDVIGIIIRLARAMAGFAEPLRPYLETEASIMLVGPPGTGKTTLLRDVVRIGGTLYNQRCIAVDTSNEIGGEGDVPHPILGDALRVHVGNPARQGEILRQAVANMTPALLVVDEIGYHGDVPHIEKASRRGVKVIGTLHGEVLMDVLENEDFSPLLGTINLERKTRLKSPAFKMALELHGKGQWILYPDLAQAIDALMQGDTPHSIKMGVWP